MRQFLINSIILLALVVITFFSIITLADGYTDAYYIRFTTPKQSSLILGTSRAAHCIQPSVINTILGRNDLFNYSFTIGHSPYGPTYLKSIERKINQNTKDGIFIVTVDPWSVSSRCKNPNDTTSFRELRNSLNKVNYVNIKPNFEYFLKAYDQPLINIIINKNKMVFLHDDGWLEVNAKRDSIKFAKNIESKIKKYKQDNSPYYSFSSVRYQYLIETIDYLKQYGSVYIVRLPVHPLMMDLDNELIPDFSNMIHEISTLKGIPFLDLTTQNSNYLYTDGNHLYKESGQVVTREIANWILRHRKS
jgi:hypothetical protein